MLRNLNQSSGGKRICGIVKSGVLASAIPAGFEFPSLLAAAVDAGDPAGCEYSVEILNFPSGASLRVAEDGSFILDGPDGTYAGGLRFRKNGVIVEPDSSYSMRVGALQASKDLAATYNVVGRVSKDTAAAYNVLASLSKDLTANYTVLEAVSKDLSASYGVSASLSISKDFNAAYTVVSSLSKDLTAGYSVLTLVSKDLAASYSVLSSGISVSKDLSAGYAVSSTISTDLAGIYDVSASVTKSLTISYILRDPSDTPVRGTVAGDGKLPPRNAPVVYIKSRF